jgi:hypothetical protein
MDSRHEDVVGDPLQEIADVDDKRALDRRGWDVDTVLVQDFQAA